MTYLEWFEAHAQKHKTIMETLTELDQREIIDYFDYGNMKEKHPDFCPLYTTDTKCHDMEALNCYFCGCMHFRFCDTGIFEENGKTVMSLCRIEAKEGRAFEYDSKIHQDCSACLIPHKKEMIEKYFSSDWREVMKNTVDNQGIMNYNKPKEKIMKQKIEEVIQHVQKSEKVSEENRPLILEKLKEWKEEENAINDIAVRFENWWMEMEPIFAELGWV